MPAHILKDAQGRPTHVILTVEEYRDLQKTLTDHPAVSEGLKRLHDPALKTYTMEGVARLVFGNNIRTCREQAGLTQEELAKRMGCTQSYISQVEQPDARPTLGTLQKLAEMIGCAVGDLVRKLT
ncbi:MAG: helix-turn-helix domain-containing protein [Candidatus Binatia bacterium]